MNDVMDHKHGNRMSDVMDYKHDNRMSVFLFFLGFYIKLYYKDGMEFNDRHSMWKKTLSSFQWWYLEYCGVIGWFIEWIKKLIEFLDIFIIFLKGERGK